MFPYMYIRILTAANVLRALRQAENAALAVNKRLRSLVRTGNML